MLRIEEIKHIDISGGRKYEIFVDVKVLNAEDLADISVRTNEGIGVKMSLLAYTSLLPTTAQLVSGHFCD